MNLDNKMIFCTLFDSNYLDKGLVLYKSMKKRISHFKLYIFAFDDTCYKVLKDLALENVIVIPVTEILDEQLDNIRKERSRSEFCWTCTPIVIEHVLLNYGEQICTYIDADCYFFSNPKPLIQEILKDNCSVGIVEHHFDRNSDYLWELINDGKYCVQFNTFVNDDRGLRVLSDWKKECMEWCYYRYEEGKLGDQKYLDKWKWRYEGVHEQQYLGGSVAPWNLHLYRYQGKKSGSIWLKDIDNQEFELIFYHFEGIRYLQKDKVFLNLFNAETEDTDQKINTIYGEYFREIGKIRKCLEEKYGIVFDHLILSEKKANELSVSFSLHKLCSKFGPLKGFMRWKANRENNLVNLRKDRRFAGNRNNFE